LRVLAWLLSSTAKTMCSAEKAIEIASYALIAAFGARLVWTKGGGFMRALQAKPAATAAAPIIMIMATITDMTTHHMIITTMIMLTATTMFMTSIAAIPTGRRRINSPARRLATRSGRDLRRRHAALLGRDPGAGVFAGAGLFWAGIAATFVMGLGTAITVATIAVVAVSAKGLARRLSAGSEGAAR
jgi:ABC-type nickel/cobalt efflux system permease component RcnA